MHIIVLFHHIGGYHAARLRAAHAVCQQRGWSLTAIQETDYAHEHPWGDISQEISFPLKTLLPSAPNDLSSNYSSKKYPSSTQLLSSTVRVTRAKRDYEKRDRHPHSTLAAQQLPHVLQHLKPDVLVIPGWGYPMSRTALTWAKHQDIATILMSESKQNDTPRKWWKEAIKSWLYVRKFHAALVGGHLHRDYLQQLGFPADGIFQGYDVVDNDHFTKNAQWARHNTATVQQQYPQIPTRPYFITVTRFIPRKNILRLIEAFNQYCQSRQAQEPEKTWDLVLCGSGQQENEIKNTIHAYGLDQQVHLPGFQTYQTLPYWFGLASAFIHPALSEQWGLVVNEALAAGLPSLVSSQCGCYPELIVEGVNGFGFQPESVDQLAQLMTRLSSDALDLQQMGNAASAHIQQFSPQTFGQGLEQAIDYAVKCVDSPKRKLR